MLASGWSEEAIADALPIDLNTVRNHFGRYRQGGLAGLLHIAYRGSCELDGAHLAPLDDHLQTQLYHSSNSRIVPLLISPEPKT